MFILQLIIIQVITFGALVFVLRKIMYSSSYLETRRLQLMNQENAKKASELQAKIEEAHKEYQAKIALAEDETKKLKIRAQEEVEKLKDEMLLKARQESEKIIEKAINSKEKMREELDMRINEKSIEQSLKLVKDILGANNLSLLHEAFIDGAIQELIGVDIGRLQVNIDKGELITAEEISAEKKSRIVLALKEKLGKSISLEEKIDKNIIAGVCIKLGSLVIDASLSEKLHEALEALRKA